jgi:tRNA (guanine-N7-)-methyltransferase
MAAAETSQDKPRLFGRRQGHPLRGRQARLVEELLPELLVEPEVLSGKSSGSGPAGALTDLFPVPVRQVVVEIGFGGGEHLLAQARRNPEFGYIGAEAYLNGFGKILPIIADEKLANIRLFQGDGEALVKALPDASVARLDLLYPDPWRKRRHWKRRFVQPRLLDVLARVLPVGAEFRFASDWPDYLTWTLMHVRRHPAFVWRAEAARDWREPWPHWPGTRYEAKAMREGRTPAYLTFERR